MSNTFQNIKLRAPRRVSYIVIALLAVLIGLVAAIAVARWQGLSPAAARSLDVALALAAMGVGALVMMYRGMGHDVVKIARAIRHLESGDLTASIDQLKTSEGSRIAGNLHRAMNGIKDIVGQVGPSASTSSGKRQRSLLPAIALRNARSNRPPRWRRYPPAWRNSRSA